MASRISRSLQDRCKQSLLQTKADILNRVRDVRHNLNKTADDRGGDEGDQTVRVLEEKGFVNENERLQKKLVEIEQALARIENGTYGICEETEEPIEQRRLEAIPWARLSIEGAELRESLNKRYVR